ncbi:multicopper oxidase domain-containing protein [Arthrobacter sp. U41]|uniref:multicopper oxidase domain-containing protein n=1 Tax=Arthrobacter sp. U41 TaxID=1849032 RepID=UPI0009F5992A
MQADGVAGVDFTPVQPGATTEYPAYEPGHAGTFAYHTHQTAEQEPRWAGRADRHPAQVGPCE